MDNDKIIQQRTEEKYKRINEYRSETQLNIQLGQAVNLALEYLMPGMNRIGGEEFERQLNAMTDFFMKFLDKKRKEVFDENEKMYAKNPIPTVEAYEKMTEVQQKFYKDKQLENNHKKYAESKKTFIKRERCPDCENWVAVGEKCARCHYVGDRYNQITK